MRDKWAYLEISYQAYICLHIPQKSGAWQWWNRANQFLIDLPAGRIPNVDVEHQKMEFLWGRWGTVELTWKCCIKSVSDSVYQACTWLRIPSLYLAPYTSKKQSVNMMKSCKSIPDGFARRKDTQCRFGPWVDWILVGEMLTNRFLMDLPAGKIPSVDLDYQQIRF